MILHGRGPVSGGAVSEARRRTRCVVGFFPELGDARRSMTSMRGLARLGLLLCAGIFADACGRTGLDLGGPEDVPVTTGAAGHALATGAAGAALEGAAGASAGIGEAGAPGTTGAAGTTATTGAAGAAMTGAAGATAVPTPMRIPCGAESCTFGTQICCA